jgi:hypothetical protein
VGGCSVVATWSRGSGGVGDGGELLGLVEYRRDASMVNPVPSIKKF